MKKDKMITKPSQTVVVTGGNTGLGYYCAQFLASDKSWHVILACRNKKEATKAVRKLRMQTSNEHIEEMTLDLASLKSVRQFAQNLADRDTPPLKAVVCNAGIQVVSGITYTQDGFETTFGVNHLGHFLLVNLLLTSLIAPGQIIFVSSAAHDPEKKTGMPTPHYRDTKLLAWPDASSDSINTAGRRRYTTSKLCNIYCTYELSRRLHPLQLEGHSINTHSITVNAFDPGMMPGSGLARNYDPLSRFVWSFILPMLSSIVPNWSTTEKSGKILAQLILDPKFQCVSGQYFSQGKKVFSSQQSYDENKAKELWEASAVLVKLKPSETIV